MISAIRRSIFLKLFLILVITGGAINFVVTTGMHYAFSPNHKFRQKIDDLMDEYAVRSVEKVASLESEAAARTYLKDNDIELRAEGARNWATSDSLPFFNQLKPRIRRHGPPPLFHHPKDRPYLSLVRGPTRYTMFWPTGPELERNLTESVILLSILSLLILVSFLAIRWTLKPLKALGVAVNEIYRGNFDYQVNVDSFGQDELAQLALSFNAMTKRIQEMIFAKEQLLLDVSHELRTPITRAKIAIEMLPPGQTVDDIASDMVEMESLVTSLLEGARLKSRHGSLTIENADLNLIVIEVAQKFKASLPEVKTVTGKTLTLSLDRERIKTVLKNLIENAIKYSASHSQVLVHVDETAEGARVRVIDRGIGIPPDELKHVFEPFYRVDKSRTRETGGFGLGLSLCRHIAQAHGGSIEIDSEENVGTTVTLLLRR
jgi:signal transduction histidine kinase